jgi:hypothetical protein
MNNTTGSKRPHRNITWQEQPLVTLCEHTYDLIIHASDGVALRQCSKCGRLQPE